MFDTEMINLSVVVITNYDVITFVTYKRGSWYLGGHKLSLKYILQEVKKDYHDHILDLAYAKQEEMEPLRETISTQEVLI